MERAKKKYLRVIKLTLSSSKLMAKFFTVQLFSPRWKEEISGIIVQDKR